MLGINPKHIKYNNRKNKIVLKINYKKEDTMVHLYRKRFIPNDIIYLKDDIILYESENLIITKWNTLKPRKDFAYGYSAYFMDHGFKISKKFDSNDNVVYWYCDIINTKKNINQNSIIFEDLLVDVLVYENGDVEILDFEELADAFDMKLITDSMLSQALRTLNDLLTIIYSNHFNSLKSFIDEIQKQQSLLQEIAVLKLD